MAEREDGHRGLPDAWSMGSDWYLRDDMNDVVVTKSIDIVFHVIRTSISWQLSSLPCS